MTAEETISILKIAIAEVEWNYPMDYAVAIETAIQALEKQIPKKPIAKPYFYGKSYYCSECKHYVCADYNTKESYCSKCGQALDWRNGNATD